jgi:hypothetical protein
MFLKWKISARVFFSFAIPVLMLVSEAAGQGLRQAPGMPQQGLNQASRAPTGRGNTAASKELFNIVKIGQDLQIVAKSGMTALAKQLDSEYKAAQKAYLEAKKDKNNKGVTLEKPEKKKIVVVKSGIKGQEKAQDELQKLQGDRDKTGDKKSKR